MKRDLRRTGYAGPAGIRGLPLALLLIPVAAHAGDVYKCAGPGGAVYQDHPCEVAGARVHVVSASGVSGATVSKGDLLRLYHELMAANAEWRRLQDEMDADFRDVRDRAGGKTDTPEVRAEQLQLQRTWEARMAEAKSRSDALEEELRQQCPHGSLLNEHEQICPER